MLAFLTNAVHFWAIFQKLFFFDTLHEKYAIVEISTKKKIIWDAGPINMRIWANEAYRFTDFSNITS